MLKLINLFVILSVFCVVAIAAPYQELPPKPGYVPVYIREGNTPLSEVNPKLVEAFHENEESHQPQIEVETPKDVEVPKYDKIDKVLEENIKEDEIEKSEQSKPISKEQEKPYEKEENQEQEPFVSDIAEFTSDDIKILTDDKRDN